MLKIILKNILLFILSAVFFYYVTEIGLLGSLVTPGVLILISTVVEIKHRISFKKENADKQ